MRTVYRNHAELAHAFAHRLSPYGSAGSTSFHGDVFRSYATSIAERVTAPDGATVYLVTAQTFSVTTSGKHMPAVRGAIRHQTSFTVAYLVNACGQADSAPRTSDNRATDAHLANVADYCERIARALQTARRARVYASLHVETAQRLATEVRDYGRTFRVAVPDWTADVQRGDIPADLAVIVGDNMRRAAAQRAADAERDAERRAEWARTDAERRDRWRAGNGVTAPGACMLRLSSDGREVQTSQGAAMPVLYARLLSSALFGGYARGHIGMTFGPWTLDAVTADSVTLGCHTIARAEIVRFVETIWPDLDVTGTWVRVACEVAV